MARRVDSSPCIHRDSDSSRGPSSPQGCGLSATTSLGYANEARFRTSASTSLGWAGRILLARMGARPGLSKRLRSTALRPSGSAAPFATPTSTRLGRLYADGPVPVKPMGHIAAVGAAITHPAFATRPSFCCAHGLTSTLSSRSSTLRTADRWSIRSLCAV
jgi:hypothetical protein